MIALARAKEVAADLLALFGPHCERVEVAGSIRRNCAEVKDVEIVAIPKLIPSQSNLFGEVSAERNLLLSELDLLAGVRIIERRLDDRGQQCWGPRHQRAVYKGVPVDVFQVLPPAQWGVIFAIRTGPAEFSKRLVTTRGFGGFMPQGMIVAQGALWQDGGDGESTRVLTPDEDDFFQSIGYTDYPKPEDRR